MNIIPKPTHVILKENQFSTKCKILGDIFFKNEIVYLSNLFDIEVSANKEKSNITFNINKGIKNIEGYKIICKPNSIIIESSHPAGAFYAIQTLRQVITTDNDIISCPCFEIDDSPEFRWRGSMVDTSRHFMSLKFLKKYIDTLALHKINRFHWHLTDDQGWRIQIKSHPELTGIGSKREGRTINPTVYGNYYTQDDIKELIKYAKDRHIEIIPEIDIPGHSTAAIAAIKELSCINEELQVTDKWGIHNKILCAGKESVFSWLDDIISEVAALFPSQFIHLGGDEAIKDYWEDCPLCKKRMEDEGLKDTFELQSYFIKRTAGLITKYGKRVLGWEEVLEGGLADDITVFSWRGIEAGIESANKGHDVIMCSTKAACYFDHKHLDDEDELGWLGVCTVKDAWSFNPLPEGITKDAKKHILGLQGNIWTEKIESPKTLEYMVFPRLTALSETMWCGTENRDWNEFQKRLDIFKILLSELGVNYYRGLLE